MKKNIGRRVIFNVPADSSMLDDLRCPYCRELQMQWEYSRKGYILYSRNGLPHECEKNGGAAE